VQGLRPEYEVDVRRAGDDRRAFLARDAAADADQQTRPLALEMLYAAEVVKHLLLRFLAHRAGVEENQVGLRRVGRRLEALRFPEHVGHFCRIVLVHLTAESLDVQLSWHQRFPACFKTNSSCSVSR
jgi:hypothetical protein